LSQRPGGLQASIYPSFTRVKVIKELMRA